MEVLVTEGCIDVDGPLMKTFPIIFVYDCPAESPAM